MSYNVSNPHPLFGKDPNIINEYGHTAYPKWVDHPTNKTKHSVIPSKEIPVRVLVNNAEEEAEVTGKRASVNWGKK